MIDGNTILIAHLGYPTTTFKAPMIYNPYFRKAGINAAVVTMPHKVTTVKLLDEVTTAVRISGSCNAILKRPDGSLLGDMFDGEGFVRAVRRKGFVPAGKNILVVPIALPDLTTHPDEPTVIPSRLIAASLGYHT